MPQKAVVPVSGGLDSATLLALAKTHTRKVARHKIVRLELPDCREAFIQAFQNPANLATKAAVRDNRKSSHD